MAKDGVTSKELGSLVIRYLPFQDNIFGIWRDEKGFHISNESNNIINDGNDLIVNDERYKGTHGLWKVLTNFTEKDLHLYKDILMRTYSIYQNKDPSTGKPKSSMGKKWKDLLSKIWREINPAKSPKTGTGLMKHNEYPIEYKCIDNLSQLHQRL
jgi:hypothetical protein